MLYSKRKLCVSYYASRRKLIVENVWGPRSNMLTSWVTDRPLLLETRVPWNFAHLSKRKFHGGVVFAHCPVCHLFGLIFIPSPPLKNGSELRRHIAFGSVRLWVGECVSACVSLCVPKTLWTPYVKKQWREFHPISITDVFRFVYVMISFWDQRSKVKVTADITVDGSRSSSRSTLLSSVIFVLIYFLVLVLPTTKEYQTCWRRRVDDLPKYRPPLVTDSMPYGRSTSKRHIVC